MISKYYGQDETNRRSRLPAPFGAKRRAIPGYFSINSIVSPDFSTWIKVARIIRITHTVHLSTTAKPALSDEQVQIALQAGDFIEVEP